METTGFNSSKLHAWRSYSVAQQLESNRSEERAILMKVWGGTKLWTDPAALSGAQRFAFGCMLPFGILAIIIGFVSREKVPALTKRNMDTER
jgi:hypothetical protein